MTDSYTVIAETGYDNHPYNYQITGTEDGGKVASNALNSVVVLPDGPIKMFQRRAIRGVGSGEPVYDTCLVAELNGVRCYVKGNQIIMSTQDLKL